MKYLILKGNHVEVNTLPAREKDEADREVARLEKLRAEHNARCDAHKASGKHERGDAFRFMKQNEPWSCVPVDKVENGYYDPRKEVK